MYSNAFNSRASMETWFADLIFWVLALNLLGIGIAQDMLPDCAATCFDNMQSLYFIGICVTAACDCEKLFTAPAGPYMGNCVDDTCSSSNKTVFDEWFQSLCGTSWPPAFTTTASLETFPIDTATAAATSEAATTSPVTTPSATLTSSTITSAKSLFDNLSSSESLITNSSTISAFSNSISSSPTTTSSPSTVNSSLLASIATSSASPTSTHSLSLSTGASVGIGVGVGIAGVLAIGALVFWFTRRKYRKAQPQVKDTSVPQVAEIQGNARGELQGSGRGGWELEGSRGLGNQLGGRGRGPTELGTYR